MFKWLIENKEWLFSGIGVVVVSTIMSFIFKKKYLNQLTKKKIPNKDSSNKKNKMNLDNSINIQAGGDITGDVVISNDSSNKLIHSSDRELINKLILFLEDRRILYDYKTGHSIASHFVHTGLMKGSKCLSVHACESILQIREKIGQTLAQIGTSNEGVQQILKRMQATCRWAIDVSDRMQKEVVRTDSDSSAPTGFGPNDYGMTFLGLFRKKIGKDIHSLAEEYQIHIEGPLLKTISMIEPLDHLDRELFHYADMILMPYMERHGGFKNMTPGWYENLCNEVNEYRSSWESKEAERRYEYMRNRSSCEVKEIERYYERMRNKPF